MIGAFVLTSFVFLASTQGFVFENEDFTPNLDSKHDQFDWELFKAVSSSNKGKNFLVSPFSIKLLLAILSEAADSDTKNQLSKVFPDVQPGLPVRILCEKYLKSLAKAKPEYELNIGTKIFVDQSISPTQNFIYVAKNMYYTTTENVNFGDASKAVEVINNWAGNITKGHISQLVEQDDVKDLVAILANAIYFKGSWEKIFSERYTHEGKFKVNSSKTVTTPIMYMAEDFYFVNSTKLNAKILRMPYKGGKYAMTFILPHDPEGLDELIANIKPGQIQYQAQRAFKKEKVDVYIPKFKFEHTSYLKNIIESLGITDIFSPRAKLSGLGKKDSKISDVVQKAGVIVDEKGTEIFAVSKFNVILKAPQVEVFDAKHPFAFFIEDESTGALLFAGKVIDPTA